MKTTLARRLTSQLLALPPCTAPFPAAPAQGTAYTCQGRLNDGAAPASGIYDLRLTIDDSSGGPALIAGPVANAPVAVSNGLSIVTLDSGPAPFDGGDRWLNIEAGANGTPVLTPLAPRQRFFDHRQSGRCSNFTGIP